MSDEMPREIWADPVDPEFWGNPVRPGGYYEVEPDERVTRRIRLTVGSDCIRYCLGTDYDELQAEVERLRAAIETAPCPNGYIACPCIDLERDPCWKRKALEGE